VFISLFHTNISAAIGDICLGMQPSPCLLSGVGMAKWFFTWWAATLYILLPWIQILKIYV